MEFNIETLVRKNIKDMRPYSSARLEYSREAGIFLDANENALGSPVSLYTAGGTFINPGLNRYPDPMQLLLKEKICNAKGILPENIFLGNGSDEAIDLLFRVFCNPGKNNVILMPPTYGMYEVCAAMNDIEVKYVPLLPSFQPDMALIEQSIDANTKLIFFCSPNNPTGNSINSGDITKVLNNFPGLVVIDEAYIHFSQQESFISALPDFPNLVILQTFSKAWANAGLRLGMAFAGKPIVNYLNKVKYPYNISTVTQQLAIEVLNNPELVKTWIGKINEQKIILSSKLAELPFVKKIYPSDANFLLVKMDDASGVYSYLCNNGIIVRNRSSVRLCEGCLRITIGNPDENLALLKVLQMFTR